MHANPLAVAWARYTRDMSSLRDAASFLTRISLHVDGDVPDMSAAVPWFGVVGLCLGATQGAIFVGISEVATPGLAAALSVAVLALITGAFHHDGLADMADGFGGGWDQQQRLDIMKDSRVGTYGATALFSVLAIEIAALASLAGWVAVAAVVTAHALSRAVATGVMITATPASSSGLGVDYLAGLSRARVVVSSVVLLLATGALFGVVALPIAGAAYLSAAAIVRLANAKIGGITGDVLGAIQQIAKVTILTAVVIAANATTDYGGLGGLVLPSLNP